MQIVWGQDEAVAAWAGAQLGVTFQQPYVAMGVVSDGSLIGASVFNDFYPGGNIELTHIGERTLTRRVTRAIVTFAFVRCEATRLTAKTPYRNTVVRRLLPKAGFRYEFTQKRYFGPGRGDDALVFVMLREHAARWLR